MKNLKILLKEFVIYHSELKIAKKNLSIYDKFILSDKTRPTMSNAVNLHKWMFSDGTENLGDYLSEVIVMYMLNKSKIDINIPVATTKHLYAVGSIISFGFQNATVWGSGLKKDVKKTPINNVYDKVNYRLSKLRNLDIRCVRGPETRRVLKKLGFKCPEVYGDPAVLMPILYRPELAVKTREYSVVRHWSDNSLADNIIPIRTTDYKGFIDAVVSSEKIVSSSLHGIILAEAYGVPAVLYIPPECKNELDEFKYRDYYYSTGRYKFPIASSVSDALNTTPCVLPELDKLRDNLLKTFPYDLWVSNK